MRWLMNLFKAVLALLVVLAVVGWLLPAGRHVERTVDIRATPEEVWPWIAEPRRWTAWSPWMARDPQTRLEYEGPAGGAGAGWRWSSRSQGDGRMHFVSADAPRSLGYELFFDEMGMKATGQFLLTPSGGGTRVVWQLDADLGWNPLARWFGLGLDNLIGSDFEAGLGRLATQVQANAKP